MLARALPLLLALGGQSSGPDDNLVEVAVNPQGLAGKTPPSLTLTARTALSGLHLELLPSRGEPVRRELGALAAGAAVRIELDAPLGASTWQGTLTATPVGGAPTVTTFAIQVSVRAALELDVPDERILLVEHRLELRMSQPAGSCDYAVTYDGAAADHGTVKFNGEPAGTWLTVRWRPTTEEAVVLRLRLRCRDAAGNHAELELFPWWLEIAHEDVSFALGSTTVSQQERPKLERAFAEITKAIDRYGKVLSIRLYVAGHTDTVGDPARNQKLSTARAQSLAQAFRHLGVTIPLWYAGFGEQNLAVPTADEVDEPRNRRARYILAVNEPEAGEWHEL